MCERLDWDLARCFWLVCCHSKHNWWKYAWLALSKLWMREGSAEGTLSYHIWGTYVAPLWALPRSNFYFKFWREEHWPHMNDSTNSHPNGCTHASKSWRLQLVFKVLWFSWLAISSKKHHGMTAKLLIFLILRITKSAIDSQFKSHCFQLHKQ